MIENNNNLIRHIEDFSRKHFLNRLYRGLLIGFILVSSVFLVVNFVEYVAFLPSAVRMVLFYAYVILFVYVLIYYIVWPFVQLYRFRRFMPVKQAAVIIGEHFPEVSDKLLNTLQLTEYQTITQEDNALLIATIKQRTEKLVVVPFSAAVNLGANMRYAKFALIPLLAIILAWLVFPAFIIAPSQRLVRYNTYFERPLPYTIKITNENLSVLQHDDFDLTITLEGQDIPDQFMIQVNNMLIPMTRISATQFSHTFKKVSQELDFKIMGGYYKSKTHTLKVFPKALLLAYEVHINFPAYMRRADETLRDISYFAVPAGSVLSWTFHTRDTEELKMLFDTANVTAIKNKNSWTFTQTMLNPGRLHIQPINGYHTKADKMTLHVDVIDDEFPTISVSQFNDELLSKSKYFTGFITDDYGFSSLYAEYIINFDKEAISASRKVNIPFDFDMLKQQFFYYMVLDSIGMQPGDNVSLQFVVRDNDRVKGPKERRTTPFVFKLASDEMLDSLSRANQNEINTRIDQARLEARKINQDVSQLNRKLQQKKELDWNDRQAAQNLMKRQNSLQNELDNLKDERNNMNRFNRDNNLMDERLLEKQAMIDKLLEEVIPEDIRKMMEELERLLEELNKDQMTEMLKKMEMSADKLEKMLDRNLALLKQLQMEKELNSVMDKLNRLAEELEKNAESTLEAKDKNDNLAKTLDEIGEKFEKEMQRLDSLRSENDKLEHPFDLQETSDDENAISEDVQKGKEQLSKKRNKESGASQKSGAAKMKQLKEKLENMMMMSSQEQLAEDAAALRYLLENIVRISFNQEELMIRLGRIRRDDPAYVDIIKNQSTIAESFKVVEDSLVTLSKRQPMIQNFVFDEVSAVKRRVGDAQEFMKDRITANAVASTQYSMMALNNLALMLSEALKNMQESMGMPSPMQGKGKSKDGKGSSKGLQNMREMQEALGKQLQNAMDGQSGKDGRQKMSEEVARMAAQQEAIRRELKGIIDQMKSEGSGADGGLNKVLEDMEKFEEQLVNKQLNQNLLKLQDDIVVRLLESEKAQKERDKEERRESNEFKGENLGNLNENIEYKRMIERQQEQLRLSPIDLLPFYKHKANSYFTRFNTELRNE